MATSAHRQMSMPKPVCPTWRPPLPSARRGPDGGEAARRVAQAGRATKARLAPLAVTHRYNQTHCLWLEQFQIADSARYADNIRSGAAAHRTSSSAYRGSSAGSDSLVRAARRRGYLSRTGPPAASGARRPARHLSRHATAATTPGIRPDYTSAGNTRLYRPENQIYPSDLLLFIAYMSATLIAGFPVDLP